MKHLSLSLLLLTLSTRSEAAPPRPPVVRSASVVQAGQLLRDGQRAEREGRLAAALELYLQSYQVEPTPNTQWYIASVCARLRLPVDGLQALDLYLAGTEEADRRPDQRQKDANRLRGTLEFQQGLLRILAAEGSQVLLDGRDLGRAPVPGAIPVNPGVHRIEIFPQGGKVTYTCKIEVPTGRSTEKLCGPPPARRPDPEGEDVRPPERPRTPGEMGLIDPWTSPAR